jgi:DNA-binding IclR family transcriptional regulator
MLTALTTSGLVIRCGVGYAAADRWATAANGQCDLLRRLSPFVGDLFLHTRLTSAIAVLDGTDVVFAHRVHSHHDTRTSSDGSGHARAHRTAAGRVLLAQDLRAACDAAADWQIPAGEAAELNRELLRIRGRGFAVAEHGDVTCVAVALPAAVHHPRIALTVRGRTPLERQDRTVYWMRTVANAAARAVFGILRADLSG